MKRNFVFSLIVIFTSIAGFGQDTHEKLDRTNTESIASGPSATSPLTPNLIVTREVAKGTTSQNGLNTTQAAKKTPRDTSIKSDEWHLEITPYVWLAGIDGNLRIGDTLVRVDSSGADVLKQVDFAFATRFEATKGRLGFFVDENYVNLGTSGLRDGPGPLVTPYDVQPTMNIFEVGPSYTIYALPNHDSSLPDVFSIEGVGGLRWFHMGLGLTAGNQHAEGSRNLVDFFGGGRLKFRPHPKWTISSRITLGGGGSQSAWTVNGLVDYQFHRNFSVNGGYQVLDMNADEPNNVVGFDGRLNGFIMGLTIHR